MKKVDLLVEGGWMITMDSQRRIFENGAVAIQGNKIVDVGQADEIRKKYVVTKKISAKNI